MIITGDTTISTQECFSIGKTFCEFSESLLSTIGKIIKTVSNLFRFIFMLPIIAFDMLLNGSKINFFSKDDPAREMTPEILEKYASFATPSKTAIRLCPSGPNSIEWKEKLIQNAEYSLEMIGSYVGGKPFDHFLQLFEEKLKSNDHILIRILACPHMLSSAQKEVIHRLEETYKDRFEVVEATSTWEVFPKLKAKDLHPKMVIADQKYFVTGGNNVNNSQLPREELEKTNYNDTIGLGYLVDIDVAGEGETARKLKTQFDEYWIDHKQIAGKAENETLDKGCDYANLQTKPLPIIEELSSDPEILTGDCSVYIGNSHQGKNNRCETEYLKMIRAAKKNILISNMLFNKKNIVSALQDAIRDGVNVEVLTNGDGKKLSFASRIQGSRNLMSMEKLFQVSHLPKAGIVSFAVQNKANTFYHTKIMVIDEKALAIGSFNIDRRSARCDEEMILVLESEEIAKKAISHIEEFKKDLKPMTEEKLKTRSFFSVRNFGKTFDNILHHIV